MELFVERWPVISATRCHNPCCICAVGAGWGGGGRSTVLGAPPALRWSLERSGLGSDTFEKKKINLRCGVKSQVEKELVEFLGDSEEEKEEENPEVLRLRAKLDKRAAKIRRLKAENEGLLKLNHELQLALCEKVLGKALPEQVPGVAVTAAVQAGISVPIGAPPRRVPAPPRPVPVADAAKDAPLRSALVAAAANGAPPRPVPAPPSPAPVAAVASGVAGLPAGDAGGPDCPPLAEVDGLAKNEIVDHTIGLQNEDEMIHAGQGVYINQESWMEMQKAESDSMFCKITASSIWPVEVLLEKSVTGTLSNKAKAAGQEKAFAPLTPHKVQALSGKQAFCLKS
ncbi:eukaryotic translation initiation factor 3 subunit A-like [Ixodes scapularis]